MTQFERVTGHVRIPARRGRPRCRPARLAGDRGRSYPRVRRRPRRHGVVAATPRRSGQRPGGRRHRPDRAGHRRRAAAERCVGRVKECRAVGTRFDKLAVSCRATVQLAVVQRHLRVLTRTTDSPDRTG